MNTRMLKQRIIHYVFRTALTMAHQQRPQDAWYIGQSGHELGQSVNVAYMPSIGHRAGYCCRVPESKSNRGEKTGAFYMLCRKDPGALASYPERFACSKGDCSSRTNICILSGEYEIHKESPSPAGILMRRLSR